MSDRIEPQDLSRPGRKRSPELQAETDACKVLTDQQKAAAERAGEMARSAAVDSIG